jgi:hypothetical protein
MSYQRPVSQFYRVGFGLGISWGTYGVSLEGSLPDPTGAYHVSDERWSQFVWFPFEHGFTGPYSWRTDPVFFWIETIRSFRKNDRKSWFELTAMIAAATPLGVNISLSTYIPDPNGSVVPVYAETELGDKWHCMIGLATERIFQFKNKDRIGFGLDWRMSLAPNYRTQLVLWPLRPDQETVSRNPHFMWLGIRVGYTFTWGDSRKPRWMRLREERGIRNGD